MQGTTSQPMPSAVEAEHLLGEHEFDLKRRRRFGEEIIHWLLLACGIVSVFTTAGIIAVLVGNSIVFFQSKAWVIAKAPVVQEEPLATLTARIDTSTTNLRVEYLAANTQFANQQYLQIGDETMRIVERNRTNLIVARGLDGTTPAAHPLGAEIFPMREVQARPQEAISAEDITIQLQDGFERVFQIGELIQIGTEEMVVNDIDQERDMLTVTRGVNGTRISAHDTNSQIAEPQYVTLSEFLTHTVWQPQSGEFGVWPLLLATLLTSATALVVAVPLGLGAAIYLAEYARPNVRNTLKPILEILAGIPTVVYGFFALTFVTPALRNLIFGTSINSLNMLAAGLTIGVLITPLISSMCEDAISAVPRSLREASVALGATKLETTVKVIIPAAISGISAAIIVAMARAVGETMIVLLASGAGPNFTFDLRQSAETMAGHIARISTGDIAYGTIDFNSIFAVGITLFIATLALNMLGNQISRRLRERY